MFNSKHNRRNTASTASPSRGSPLRSSADRRSPGRNSPKFSPDHDMRPDMSREERAEYKELFDILDDDQSGYIEPRDLKEAMRMLGFEPQNASIFHIFSWIDRSCQGHIGFETFIDIMTDNYIHKDKKSDVDKLFRLFDENKQNYITLEDLRSISRDLGEHCSEQELREMIKRTDTNGDGRVSIDDLYNVLTK